MAELEPNVEGVEEAFQAARSCVAALCNALFGLAGPHHRPGIAANPGEYLQSACEHRTTIERTLSRFDRLNIVGREIIRPAIASRRSKLVDFCGTEFISAFDASEYVGKLVRDCLIGDEFAHDYGRPLESAEDAMNLNARCYACFMCHDTPEASVNEFSRLEPLLDQERLWSLDLLSNKPLIDDLVDCYTAQMITGRRRNAMYKLGPPYKVKNDTGQWRWSRKHLTERYRTNP